MTPMAGREGSDTLGILAGSGVVPQHLIAACLARGRKVFVIAFEGHTDPDTAAMAEHHWARLGAAGEIIDVLHAHDVRDICLAGPVKRPTLKELRPDLRATKFFAKIGKMAFSDDGLLGSVVRTLEEEEGFRVVGIDDLLDSLLATPGTYGRHAPDDLARSDIERGVEVARVIGRLDVGQAVVVQQGVVLGLEAVEGTDRLLARAGELRQPGAGGVLVKIKKPQQERRVDLPTIGARTVETAAAAGLRGIAVQAGGALVIDRAATTAAADAAGIFLVGLALDE
jgi:DUF1009 family protein